MEMYTLALEVVTNQALTIQAGTTIQQEETWEKLPIDADVHLQHIYIRNASAGISLKISRPNKVSPDSNLPQFNLSPITNNSAAFDIIAHQI
jgi:hypothetical protein